MPATHAALRAARRLSRRSRPCRNARVRHPGRARTRFRPRGSAARTRADMRGPAEATRRASATDWRIIDTVPDGVEDVGHGRAEAVAESAGQGDGGGGATSGRVWGSGAQRGAPTEAALAPIRRGWAGRTRFQALIPPAPMRARDDDQASDVGAPARRRVATSATRRESSRASAHLGATAVPRPVVLPARQRSLRIHARSAGLT